MPKKDDYSNESIIKLKDEERVRKRPAVIFGSDGLEGCEHSFFEILSNSIDEAREEGLEKGLERGRHEERLELIRKMLSKGLPLEVVSDVTGLSLEELEVLLS